MSATLRVRAPAGKDLVALLPVRQSPGRELPARERARVPPGYAEGVGEEKLRRVHVKVLVGGEDVEITWATRNELLKLLQRAAGTLQVVLYLENVGTLRPVDLDRDGKEHLFRALTYWQDHPAPGKSFPDDAQALWTALADELAA